MSSKANHDRISRIQFFGRLSFIAGLVAAASLIFGGPDETSERSRAASSPDSAEHLVSLSSSKPSPTSQRSVGTRSIEEIRVGDRVLARNPEVTDAERATWEEPDWNDWVHLCLQMPLPSADEDENSEPKILNIEILRPESWFWEQIGFVVDESSRLAPPRRSPTAGDPAESISVEEQRNPESSSARSDSPRPDDASAGVTSSTPDGDREYEPILPLSPLRSVYRDLAMTVAEIEADGTELIGMTVEMDLPEMGASGTAIVTNIKPVTPIRHGKGRVVTATFSHPPSTQVLDVAFEGETDSIGVTDNHLFWSVDREQFIAIGQMEIGEQVQTYFGQTKRIAQQLPRPGPQVVYNLEVYGEHVYFVGEQGLLVHNSYSTFLNQAKEYGLNHKSANYLHRTLREGIKNNDLSKYRAALRKHEITAGQQGALTKAFKKPGMGNQLGDQKAELYFLRDRDSGKVVKIGETTNGAFTGKQTRYSQPALDRMNAVYQPLMTGTKSGIRNAENVLLLKWNKFRGNTPLFNDNVRMH